MMEEEEGAISTIARRERRSRLKKKKVPPIERRVQVGLKSKQKRLLRGMQVSPEDWNAKGGDMCD